MKLGETIQDHVSIYIDDKLRNLPPMPLERCIFRVHHQLRQVNEKAYEPQMLAIGPYHRNKDSVKVMEEHKLLYLQKFLARRNEISVERFVVKLRGLEKKARNCYAESVSLCEEKFVEMMLLDGCFIIELFQKTYMMELRDDPIFDMKWTWNCLKRDLLLVENQLPFFVLNELFNISKDPHLQCNLKAIALNFLSILSHPRGPSDSDENSSYEIKHLLGLVHNNMIPKFAKERDNTGDVVNNAKKMEIYTLCHGATRGRSPIQESRGRQLGRYKFQIWANENSSFDNRG